jgi:hypothetical protein
MRRIMERKGERRKLLLKISSHDGDDSVHFLLDIAPQGRGFEDPTSVFCPPLEVMGVALQFLDFDHALVRIIIPAEEPLITGVGKPEINECIRVAPGRRIVVDVKKSSLVNNGPDFGPNQTDFTEQAAGFQPPEDDLRPDHQRASKIC